MTCTISQLRPVVHAHCNLPIFHFGFEDKIWFFLCKFLHIAHLSSFDIHALCNRSFFKLMFHFLVPSTHQCGE